MRSGSWLARFAREESGAAGIEYGLIVAAVSAAIVVSAFAIGNSIENAFNFTWTTINTFI
jgi:Flp pilus assembly pilin Flp